MIAVGIIAVAVAGVAVGYSLAKASDAREIKRLKNDAYKWEVKTATAESDRDKLQQRVGELEEVTKSQSAFLRLMFGKRSPPGRPQ